MVEDTIESYPQGFQFGIKITCVIEIEDRDYQLIEAGYPNYPTWTLDRLPAEGLRPSVGSQVLGPRLVL